jgi:phage shock protein A
MLIKADLNDLIDKAQNPERLIKQLLLDMQNQYLQVKTQVAMAVADQHLLEQRRNESLAAQKEWIGKAELALKRGDEQLARAALERSVSQEKAAAGLGPAIQDQAQHVLLLRDALHRLEQKMTETKMKAELLFAQHRRARLGARPGLDKSPDAGSHADALLEQLRWKVAESEALGQARSSSAIEPDIEQKLASLELDDRVNRLLEELKTKAAKPDGS